MLSILKSICKFSEKECIWKSINKISQARKLWFNGGHNLKPFIGISSIYIIYIIYISNTLSKFALNFAKPKQYTIFTVANQNCFFFVSFSLSGWLENGWDRKENWSKLRQLSYAISKLLTKCTVWNISMFKILISFFSKFSSNLTFKFLCLKNIATLNLWESQYISMYK